MDKSITNLPAPAVPAVTHVAERPWHALDAEVALQAFASGEQGLDAAEAAARLTAFGPNHLPQLTGRGPLLRFLLQFHNVLIYTLLAAAVLSAALGHWIDAGVVLAVTLANAIIGFVQEGKATQALEAIRGMIDPKATVLRDGHRVTVSADMIVPGDIVLIEAGARVPADVRLIRARGLRIDEAMLTGESVAADKAALPVEESVGIGDRRSMAFSGTFVTAGQAVGIAVATGQKTELGRISVLLGAVESLQTPLVRQMDRFASQLTAAILAVSALIFLFALFFRDYSVGDAFMVVVGIAVSAIPEGLPAIMTITLAIGVQRMASRHAIIRRLPAAETLGSVSVICSDKTGTLTRNEMSAESIVTGVGEYEVTGGGRAPDGRFRLDGAEIDAAGDSLLLELLRAGLLCNDAEFRQVDGEWRSDGDPMEAALVALAMKAGLDPALLRRQLPRSDEIPFDALHRFMATLHHSHEGRAFVLVKGAPERILDMCASERSASGDVPLDGHRWHRVAMELAARGERVLGFAMKPVDGDKHDLTFADVDADAIFIGFVGFLDPPREEAIAAIADCHTAGIRVVMITGDHATTAREIARQLGIAEDPKVLTGQELDALDAEGLRLTARETDVFARTTPEHKLRLVQALQADGLTVAMTGDGVNDAPALKRADVGVAMGENGTEVAKEAAEVVLADDNFASIVAAVREGRTVYDNVMKVITWTLPTNGGEGLTIIAALAAGFALPMTPVQILWINTITAVALGLTFAFEPTEPDAMRRPPRAAHQPILTLDLLWRVLFVSVLFVTAAFGVFFWSRSSGASLETARTMVVNTLVVMEIAYLFSVRYVHGTSLTWTGVVGTPAVLIGVGTVVVGQLAFTYLPVFQYVFGSRPLTSFEGAIVIGIGIAVLLVVEAEKQLRLSLFRRRSS
jgi:magnesium-transporting ATPase (P-type)